jgi:hypothetical protein
MNKLVREELDTNGKKVYKMVSFDVEVVAKHSGGLAPTITYLLHEEDITEDIRNLRFHFQHPASFIEDFPQFQTMLYEKEQKAINRLYDQYSIRPKNMPAGKQVLWSFFVLLLITIPIFVVALLV